MSGHQPAGGGGVQAQVHVRGRAQPPHRVPHQQTLPVITRQEHLATTTDNYFCYFIADNLVTEYSLQMGEETRQNQRRITLNQHLKQHKHDHSTMI